MEYTHKVQKWNGEIFVQCESSSTSYYSMGAYMPGDDDIDEVDVDTLGELYKLWPGTHLAEKRNGNTAFTSTLSRKKSARTESRYLPTTFAREKSTGEEIKFFSNRRSNEEGYI